MDSTSPLDTTNFLQQQLAEIVTLLEKQELENSLVSQSTSNHRDLEETLLLKQHQARIQERLENLHPADIAFILESLPLDYRQVVWDSIKAEDDGPVLLEVSDAVRETLISGMETEELANVANSLDADEIADLAADMPKPAMFRILRSLNNRERSHLKEILSYQDNQVGALMDFGMIAIRDDLNLEAIIDYIRKLGKLPGQTDKLFVVDQDNIVKGVLPLQRLLTHSPLLMVGEVMVSDFVQFQADHETADASRAFERYDLVSAPVVDSHGKLLGRLCIDSIVD